MPRKIHCIGAISLLFLSSLSSCRKQEFFADDLKLEKKEGKYGYVNSKGDVVIPFVWDAACPFSEGCAVVKKNGKYGYVNPNGDTVIPFLWDDAYPFSEGCAVVKKNGKYGAIDHGEEIVIPFKYVWLEMFHNGRARFRENIKIGFIDHAGRCVIDPIWLEAEPFSCDLARVSHDRKKWGYINKTGEIVIPLVWDYAHSFVYKRALVRVGRPLGKWGAINTKGKVIIEPKWAELGNLDQDYLMVSNEHSGCDWENGAFAIINNRGKLMTGFIFSHLKPLVVGGNEAYREKLRYKFFNATVGSNQVFVHNSGLYGKAIEPKEGGYVLLGDGCEIIARFDEKGNLLQKEK